MIDVSSGVKTQPRAAIVHVLLEAARCDGTEGESFSQRMTWYCLRLSGFRSSQFVVALNSKLSFLARSSKKLTACRPKSAWVRLDICRIESKHAEGWPSGKGNGRGKDKSHDKADGTSATDHRWATLWNTNVNATIVLDTFLCLVR